VPSKSELYHLAFSGNSHGWIVGDNGLLMATTTGTDVGVQTTATKLPLYNVDFRDDKEGYAVVRRVPILKTRTVVSPGKKVDTNFKDTLMRVDFADEQERLDRGIRGAILRSADRGSYWIRQEKQHPRRLYGLHMTKKYGWAVGANGVVLEYRK